MGSNSAATYPPYQGTPCTRSRNNPQTPKGKQGMWTYRAALHRVIDGDTLELVIDNGFGSRQQEAIRLLDVWAPELNKSGGKETKAYVEEWMRALRSDLRWPIIVTTQTNTMVEPTQTRTFTRYVGTIWPYTHTGPTNETSLNSDVRQYIQDHPQWQ